MPRIPERPWVLAVLGVFSIAALLGGYSFLPLKARPDAYLVDVGAAVEIEIEPEQALPRLSWTISDTALLRREGESNRFVGLAEGVVTVTAAVGASKDVVKLFVRADPARATLRSVEGVPVDVVRGRRVIRGEVIVTLKPGVTPEERRALWRRHRLIPAGEIPSQRTYQLAFEPPETLEDAIAQLEREPLVAYAIPHSVGGPL